MKSSLILYCLGFLFVASTVRCTNSGDPRKSISKDSFVKPSDNPIDSGSELKVAVADPKQSADSTGEYAIPKYVDSSPAYSDGHDTYGYGPICHNKVEYVTKYKTKVRQVPVYKTVAVPQYVPVPVYETKQKIVVKTIYKDEPVKNPVFQTQVIPQYVHLTKTNYHVKTVNVPEYVTEKAYKKHEPIVTKENVVWKKVVHTKFITAFNDEPIYVTKTQYNRITKVNKIPQATTIKAFDEHLVLKTVCHKGYGYGGY